MPMDTGVPDESERTDSVESYKVTCADFVKDISADYLAWVDYYKLPAGEDARRRAEIAATIRRTNEWIARVPSTIKGVDVVMNDGIQKMAEATAGWPFELGVYVNGMSGYTAARPGAVAVDVRAAGREGRAARLGFHFKDDRFRLESTGAARLVEDGLPLGEYRPMDARLVLDASGCAEGDVVSFTVTVEEVGDGGQVTDRRGASTIVHLA